MNEKTGDNSFQEMITQAAVDDNKWVYWRPEIFSDMFARRTFMPLPPRDDALSLLKDFFENFNCMFPLFHEPTFMHLVDKQYSRQPYEGTGWWASFNIALAIAHRIRVMSNLVPQEEDNKAWLFLKNAMGVLTELTMRNQDLLSVQALLGMVRTTLFCEDPSANISSQGNVSFGYSESSTIIFLSCRRNSIGKQHRSSQARLSIQPKPSRDRTAEKSLLDRISAR